MTSEDLKELYRKTYGLMCQESKVLEEVYQIMYIEQQPIYVLELIEKFESKNPISKDELRAIQFGYYHIESVKRFYIYQIQQIIKANVDLTPFPNINCLCQKG